MRYWRIFRQLPTDTRGASTIEYGLILALVFFAILTVVGGMAGETIHMWGKIDSVSREARKGN